MRSLDAIVAAALLALLSGSTMLLGQGEAVHAATGVSPEPRKAGAALCGPSETIVYSCSFRARTASICLGDGRVSYRYGRPGKLELEIASDGKDGRARFGFLRGQINGEQVSIRFVNGQYHYIIYSAVYGDATIRPGEQASGLVVEKAGRTLAEHRCALTGDPQGGAGFHKVADLLPEDEDAPWY